MRAWASYDITLRGTADEIQRMGNVLKSVIKDDRYEIGEQIRIAVTCDCMYEDGVCALAKAMAKVAPTAEFTLDSVTYTSTCGEDMAFLVELKQGKLMMRQSEWYSETSTENFEDYEEFCEYFNGWLYFGENDECPFTEEDVNRFKEWDFMFLIEGPNGYEIYGEVPLKEAVELPY